MPIDRRHAPSRQGEGCGPGLAADVADGMGDALHGSAHARLDRDKCQLAGSRPHRHQTDWLHGPRALDGIGMICAASEVARWRPELYLT